MTVLSSALLDAILSIRITDNNTVISASGVLITGGDYVLTAAHLFDNYQSSQSIDIVSANGTVVNDAEVFIYHGWDKTNTNFNHDIAIIKLSSRAASAGLALFQATDIEGLSFTLTGFGNNGSIHTGTNVFDGDGSLFNISDNKNVINNTQVLYDYDNGLALQNTSYNLFNSVSTRSPTTNETIAKVGDSGGALLVNNEVAAISSYISSNPLYDVNAITDSSYGEVGAATRIATYIPWIEYITDGNQVYTSPSVVSDVNTMIPEPFSGSVINHFLLSTSSVRSETVSLRYVTRDGTATAGEDYSFTQGSVELLPSQTYIAIAVNILGDTVAEIDETFSLVLTDPTNEWLGIDVELIATHTIVNNDVFSV
jgi:hypothetical protein